MLSTAGLLLCLAGCGGGDSAPLRLEPGTPVVLISIDTLRSDRLPSYGYSVTATPAIDRLATDGVVFDRAYSHSPLTLPSHVSLLTGVLPTEHRIRDNIGYPLDPERVPLLARELQAAGYRTGGFVSSFVLRRDSGIAVGFEVWDDGIDFSTAGSLATLQRPGGETLALASSWLNGVADEPFLLFLHLYEPHTPYAPPEPFASSYSSPYDGEVAAADAVVRDLLEQLDRLGLYDRALIVLLSDHGEGLGEHGELEHGVFLYRSTLQVPLILKLPGSERAGTRVSSTVQLTDLFPTVLDLLGLKPDARLTGTPLTRALNGELEQRAIYAETYYPRLHFGWSELFSVVREQHHLIDAPEAELYDLRADPGETSNLVEREPALYQELASELERYDRTLDAPEEVDEATRRRLAALGYIGATAGADDGPLPDPKQQLGSLRQLRLGAALVSAGRHGEAIPVLRALLADQPQILDAWDYLARSLEALGRDREALRVYVEALSRFPGNPLLSLAAARLNFRLGLLEPAALLAQAAVEVDSAAAQALLSQVALRRGDLEQAAERARLAREARDSRPDPDLAYADVLIARERFDEALQVLDELEARLTGEGEPDPALLRGLAFLRGKSLARSGRAPEAEQAFMQEIERFPTDTQAYTHLSLLYGLLGMQREAVVVVGKLLQVNGSPYAVGEALKCLDRIGAKEQADQLVREARRRFPDDPYLRDFISARTP